MAKPTCDELIIEHLKTGALVTDPDSGTVFRRGVPVTADNGHGYLLTSLGGGRRATAQRVVWIDANGPIPPGMEVNHINCNRGDNRLVNLELVTKAGNARHAVLNRLLPRPGDHEKVAARSPQWYAAVKALAERGNVTAEEVEDLRRMALYT